MNGKEHSDAPPEDRKETSAPVQGNTESGSSQENSESSQTNAGSDSSQADEKAESSQANAGSAADAYKTALTIVDGDSAESVQKPEQDAEKAVPSADDDGYKTEMTMVDDGAGASGAQAEVQGQDAAETKTEVMPQEKAPGKAFRKPGQLLAEGDKLGKYTINKRLGKGGMGEVYLATHDTLNIKRAIKILPKEIAEKNSQFLARFLREAKTACEIRHSNVVNVMDVETDQERGLSYIVMEFVDGGDVRG